VAGAGQGETHGAATQLSQRGRLCAGEGGKVAQTDAAVAPHCRDGHVERAAVARQVVVGHAKVAAVGDEAELASLHVEQEVDGTWHHCTAGADALLGRCLSNTLALCLRLCTGRGGVLPGLCEPRQTARVAAHVACCCRLRRRCTV